MHPLGFKGDWIPMGIDDYVTEIEYAAEEAALDAKAVYRCPVYPHVTISSGDSGAERHAYALLTYMWKCEDCDDERKYCMESLRECLGQPHTTALSAKLMGE